jgi:16S rRNA G966 N2-methylase RsmD
MISNHVYIYKYFPYICKFKYPQLKIDDVGLYSISTPKNADIISELIKKNFVNNNIIITDAMAGVGGNTLSFASNFYYVNAIELNVKRFNYLTSNVNLYAKDNVLCIRGDCLDLIYQVYQDVIFMDPPWGGKTYKEFEEITLEISGKSLELICEEIRLAKICKMIVLKLPLNYNLNNFSQCLKESLYIEELKKMQIVIFKIN